VALNRATISQVYDKFRQIAGQDNRPKKLEYVSKAELILIVPETPTGVQIWKRRIERSLRSERWLLWARGLGEQEKSIASARDYDTERSF